MKQTLKSALHRFRYDESGVVTVQFVIIFPVFFFFFLMTYEHGVIAVRNVMLERGVDMAVRDVRIGTMVNPTGELLRKRICDVAGIIPDCENQMQIEMDTRDPRNWVAIPSQVNCIDRSVTERPVVKFVSGGSNRLVYIRACIRINPMLPTTGIGKAIVDRGNAASGGSYALVASSAYVVEPTDEE